MFHKTLEPPYKVDFTTFICKIEEKLNYGVNFTNFFWKIEEKLNYEVNFT